MKIVVAVAVATLVLVACSSGDDPVQPEAAPTTIAAASDGADNIADEADSQPDTPDRVENAADSEDSAATDQTPEPARRVPAQVSDETTHWVGHGIMTDEAIEVVWSEVEGEEVVHQIFRFDSVGLDPEAVELTTPGHEGINSSGWTDDSVEPGSFYTYVMRVIADDEVLERRWTDTLAVTDTTPPSDITGLSASVGNGEVLLEWDVGADDVEFGSYGVYRTDLADEPQYVGGGADLTVTSFIDNDLPAAGDVGYEVVAFDFHGNRSNPTPITVEVP